MLFLKSQDRCLEDSVDVDETKEIFEKVLDKVGLAAERFLSLRKLKNVIEAIVEVFETV